MNIYICSYTVNSYTVNSYSVNTLSKATQQQEFDLESTLQNEVENVLPQLEEGNI